MVIAINPGETWEFIGEADRELPASEQTGWTLRYLTAGEHRQLQNGITVVRGKDGSETTLYGDFNLRVLQTGLVGVRNLRDEKGADVPFESDMRNRCRASEAFLSRIPVKLRDEISSAILSQGANSLTEEEAKN